MSLRAPGVYLTVERQLPAATLPVGVPVFLGYVAGGPLEQPVALASASDLDLLLGGGAPDGFVAAAVRGFFANGGRLCYALGLDPAKPPETALAAGLAAAEPEDAVDLVCAPDIVRPAPGEPRVYPDDVVAMQRQVLEACDRTDDRFAILDPLPATDVDGVLAQRETLSGRNGALYFPWIRSGDRLVPPCGHVAGVYALTDGQAGVHKAPANVALEDALDALPGLDAADQARLNPAGVNAIRVFPGRGIRIWGARTLSREPEWIYVNVRRTFVTLGRWIALNLAGLAFEPNDPLLWGRVNRALSGHLVELWQAGALRGATAEDAFYVKCDADTNPDEVRSAGRVVAEVGLAPSMPNEFVTVRVVLGDGAAALGPNGGAGP